jgi:hypothetical protein
VGSQSIVVTTGAGCELETVLALESCYLALLLNRPQEEVTRITLILGRFAHGVGATGEGQPSAAQRILGRFHNTTINRARSLTKATAIRRQQVRAVFVTLLGVDAVPSPDVARIEQPLRAALRDAALLAFRLGGEPVHAPCPEPKAAAVLIVAWAEAATTAASIMRDELFIPYLEERMAQVAPPREMQITLLALQAAEMPGEMKQKTRWSCSNENRLRHRNNRPEPLRRGSSVCYVLHQGGGKGHLFAGRGGPIFKSADLGRRRHATGAADL